MSLKIVQRLSLAALVSSLSLVEPAHASLTEDDLMHPRYAAGRCEYHGYILDISCDLSKPAPPRCQIDQAYTLQGKKTSFSYGTLPNPDVVIQPPTILYCKDPPEKKKEEKKPFLCC